MGKNRQSVSDGQKNVEIETTRTLLLTIGDTTWRMFVPSVGFTLLGVWLDNQFGSKPLFLAIGVVVGFAGAILLVKKQLDALKTKRGNQNE